MTTSGSAAATPKEPGRVGATIKLLLVLAILAGVGWYFTSDTLERAKDEFVPATVVVTEEYTDQVLSGTRRNKHYVDARFVRVQFEDGTIGGVRSDDLQVGDTVEVWQNTETKTLVLEEPDGPGFLSWVLVILPGLLALPVLYSLVRVWRPSKPRPRPAAGTSAAPGV